MPAEHQIENGVLDFQEYFAPLLVSFPSQKAVADAIMAYLRLEHKEDFTPSITADQMFQLCKEALFVLISRGAVKFGDLGLSTLGEARLTELQNDFNAPAPVIEEVVQTPSDEEEFKQWELRATVQQLKDRCRTDEKFRNWYNGVNAALLTPQPRE